MSDRPASDIHQDVIERHSFLDGLNHFTGVFALIVTAMVGLDFYFWLWLNRPPQLAILWVPPLAARMWTRVATGDDRARLPASWYRTMAAYSFAIIVIEVFRGLRTSEDWWLMGFAAFWTAVCLWSLARETRG